MRILFLVTLFIFLGAFIIVSHNDLNLKKTEEFYSFYTIYYDWIIGLLSNVGTATANVVKLDWFPDTNSTH